MNAMNDICGLDLIIYADVAGFLGHLCSSRPESGMLTHLAHLPVPKPVNNTASGVFNQEYAASIQDIQNFIITDAEAALKAAVIDWNSLFNGARPDVTPFARETLGWDEATYRRYEVELKTLYAACPVPPLQEGVFTRSDFVGTQLFYLAWLMGAAANQEGVSLDDVWRFTEKYVSPWVPRFCERGLEAAHTPLYRRLLHLMSCFLDFIDRLRETYSGTVPVTDDHQFSSSYGAACASK